MLKFIDSYKESKKNKPTLSKGGNFSHFNRENITDI